MILAVDKKQLQNGSLQSVSTMPDSLYNYPRTIHVHETDKDGVVHFSNYYRIAEEAFFSWLKYIGYAFEDNDYSVAMINSSASYFNPMKFADQIDVSISEVKIQRVKLIISFDFYGSNKTRFAKIQFTLVFINVAERASIPLPQSLQAILSQIIQNQDGFKTDVTDTKDKK